MRSVALWLALLVQCLAPRPAAAPPAWHRWLAPPPLFDAVGDAAGQAGNTQLRAVATVAHPYATPAAATAPPRSDRARRQATAVEMAQLIRLLAQDIQATPRKTNDRLFLLAKQRWFRLGSAAGQASHPPVRAAIGELLGAISAAVPHCAVANLFKTMKAVGDLASRNAVFTAELRRTEPGPLDAIGAVLASPAVLPRLSAGKAVRFLWMVGRLGLHRDALFRALGRHLLDSGLRTALTPRYVAMVLVGMVRSRSQELQLAREFFEYSVTNLLQTYSAQDLTLTLWAAAKLGLRDETLTGRLAQRALAPAVRRALGHFGVSTVAWAFATLRHTDTVLFEALAKEAMACIPSFAPVGVSKLLWAYATLRIHPAQLFAAMGDHIVEYGLLPGFTPQGVTTLAWAYAALQHPHPVVGVALEHVQRPDVLLRCQGQDAADAIWAAVRLGLASRQLMVRFAAWFASGGLDRCSGRELGIVAWAFATTRFQSRQMLQALSDRALQPPVLWDLAPKSIAMIAWSCAVLRHANHTLFLALGDQVVQRSLVAAMKPQDVSNLAWACAAAGVAHPPLMAQLGAYMADPANLPRCAPQEISNFLWAMATLHIRFPLTLDAIVRHLLVADRLPAFGAPELSNAAWALAALRWYHQPALRAIATQLTRLPLPYPACNLAQTWWALARSETPASELWALLAAHARQLVALQLFNIQDSSTVLWAVAKVGVPQPELVDDLLSYVFHWGAGRLAYVAIATTAWAMAKLNVWHVGVAQLLAEEAVRPDVLPTFLAPTLAMTAWAFAQLQYPNPALLLTLARHVADNAHLLQGMQPLDIARFCHALATAEVDHHDCLVALATRALAPPDFLLRFSPQMLANTLWAFGALQFHHVPFIQAAAQTILWNHTLDLFTPQEVANTFWALAKLGIEHPPLIQAIMTRLLEPGHLERYNEKELASLAWSCATLQLRPYGVLQAIVHSAVKGGTLPSFGTQATAVLLWSFAQLGLRHATLLAAVAAKVREPGFLPQCNTHELYLLTGSFSAFGVRHTATIATMTAWLVSAPMLPLLPPADLAAHSEALAYLGPLDPAAIATLAAQYHGFPAAPAAAHAVSLAWALLAADAATDALLQPLVPRLGLLTNHMAAESPARLTQVQQVLHSIQTHPEWPMANAALEMISSLVSECRILFVRLGLNTPRSDGAASMLEALGSLNIPAREHTILLEAGGYHTDLLWVDRKVVFELLGRAHLVETEAGWQPNGGSVLRWRHLAADGYRVVPIPLYNWLALETAAQRQAFLAARLQGLHLR